MGEFLMPSLGADMDEGTLQQWLVDVGDEVARGQLVAVVETEKADVDVEVFESGRVAELLVHPGTTVAVGTPLARIEGEQASAPPPPTPAAGRPPRTPAAPRGARRAAPHVTSPLVRHLAEHDGVDLDHLQGSGPGGTVTRADVEAAERHADDGATRIVASPYARRLAAEQGIELGGRHGSGPGGALLAADVRRVPGAPPPTTTGGERAAGDRAATVRRATAEVLSRAKREIPHYYLSNTVDLHAALEWLDQRNASLPPDRRVLPAALLLKATALAARAVPELNGTWEDGSSHPAEQVHLGVAVSLRGGGLVAPAIPDADRLDLDALMAALRDVVTRTRAGRLRRTELTEGTITVTNLGERGVDVVHGIVQPPQVALVGFGRIAERPWAVDGMLAVRPVVTTSLSADHRASDGRTGARLLDEVDRRLQDPATLEEAVS